MSEEQKAYRPQESGDRGASAVEFGLVLPVLLAILLGIMDYGFVFFQFLSMTNAAREGARVGVTRQAADAASEAEAAANTYLSAAGLGAASVSATTPSDADPTVTVTVTLSPFTPLIGFVPTPSQLTTQAAMRWELAPIGP